MWVFYPANGTSAENFAGAGGVKSSAGEFRIARNGQALADIVIADDAGKSIQLAAEEFKYYLNKITGAKFRIVKAKSDWKGIGREAIVIGAIGQFKELETPDLRRKLAIIGEFDGKEAFVIKTYPGRLILLGATEQGAVHSIFRFLQEIGCRWFFPGEHWRVIPKRNDLSVKFDIADRPAFLCRSIWYQWGYFDRKEKKCQNDYDAWVRHNLLGASLKIYCGHAWQNIISLYRNEFKRHPEYLALHIIKDKKTGRIIAKRREGNKFCVSNPGLVALCKRYAIEYFRKHPQADMVSMEPSDGGGDCQCENCRRMGTISDRVFYLANEVAKAVDDKYPGKFVGLLAYNYHSEPPDFKLEPNVYVQLTAGFIRGKYTYDELLELWPKRCSHLGFYDYFSVYQWNWDMIPGGRGANVPYLINQIKKYKEHNGTSISAESGNNWGLHGRGYYLASKLMWNPYADADAILEDFYSKAFGRAAGIMKRYYERIDPSAKPLMGRILLYELYKDIRDACLATQGRRDIQNRLDDLKVYLRYCQLWWQYKHTKNPSERKELAKRILTHVYRSRYRYMNHWEAIRQVFCRRISKEFNEPIWRDTKRAPWIGKSDYTHNEIEKFFNEGLKYFKPNYELVDEVKFSDNFVPVKFGTCKQYKDPGFWSGALKFVLYSVEGKPLIVQVDTGLISWYRNRPDAKYKFKDVNGNIIKKGKIKLDGKRHRLICNVPSEGVYYFEFNDSGAGWRIYVPVGQPWGVPLKGQRFIHHGINCDLYFYVPKKTKVFQYFWASSGHRILGPDGQLIKQVGIKDSGDYITVKVPKGLDGKIWRFHGISLTGRIEFRNMPNVLSFMQGIILLPKELAQRDNLPIMTGKR